MKNILIIDQQEWIVELVNASLHRHDYVVSIVPDAENILEHIKANWYDLVLLSHYLKHGYQSWAVFQDIKTVKPRLPVIILAAYDKYLHTPQLKRVQGYVVNSRTAVNELRQMVNAVWEDDSVDSSGEETDLASELEHIGAL